ncbi:hypothetical protein D0T60_05360 [Bacteroides sp. 224]|nr:hypothetical protein [Bacteroides sp. 224]
MTRAKKVPLLYSENYNYPNVKSIRTEKNKQAWIVYSDRADNMTKGIPNGTIDHTKLEFMEPLIVIGKKGDYYKLIKYDPAVLKNQKLTNRKAAKYCGWIHKDRLLLFDNTITEVRNGIKLKNLTSITDSHVIFEADKYFENDSLILYSEPKLESPTGSSMGLNNIAYILKFEDRDSKALVCFQTQITPENADSSIIGWIDASLIAPMGQRLISSRAPMIFNEAYATDSIHSDSLRATISPLKSFYPVLFADHVDSTLIFRSLDAGYVIDRSDNRIFNVNGEPITFAESKIIADNLVNINVIFAFDLTESVISQMPMLSNIIQNVKQVFETSPSELNYQFAAALGNHIIPFEKNYLSFSDRIMEVAKELGTDVNHIPNLALSNAVKLAGEMPRATNLIVYLGEKSSTAEYPSRTIVDSFINYNCRLLSYQVYADNQDIYNNFVLQSTALIEAYADTTKVLKRKLIVYSDQLRKINLFKENTKNAYALDFPQRSMTQGMVVFPEKTRQSEPELLINGIDSIVRQIEYDNLNLISSMENAFNQVGSHRNRYDSIFSTRFNMAPETKVAPTVTKVFDKVSPKWVSITPRISNPIDSLHLEDMGLLLTEKEHGDLVEFFEKLSAEKPDMKGGTKSSKKVQKVKKVRKKLRNVPSDSQLELQYSSVSDTLSTEKKYANTKSIRKKLKKLYLNELKKCVVDGKPKKLTLAEAHEYITTLPSIAPQLTEVRIKDLTSKKKFPDAELEELILYFEEIKALIEAETRPANELNGTEGGKYFIIPKSALP